MNRLDIAIIICIGFGILKGLFDGCIKQVFSFAALALSILFAGLLAGRLQGIVGMWAILPQHLEYPVCYVAAFILILLLMGWVGRLAESVANWSFLGCVNSLAGGVVGMMITVIALSLAFNFFVFFDRDSRILGQQTRVESVLFNKIRDVVPTLYPYVKHKIESEYNKYPFPEKEDPGKSPEKRNNDIFEI